MSSKKFAFVAALLFAASMSTAYSQGVGTGGGGCYFLSLANGEEITCIVDSSGNKVYIDGRGVLHPGSSFGDGTFRVLGTSSSPCAAILAPVDINVTSTAGAFGTVNVKLDPARISSPSGIISTAPTSATEDIYFYATATVSSLPGKSFRSIQEIHLYSNNVTTFKPHVQEPFTLVNQVDFEDVANPGVIAFSLHSLTVILN